VETDGRRVLLIALPLEKKWRKCKEETSIRMDDRRGKGEVKGESNTERKKKEGGGFWTV